ncbi:MAG: NAD(P)H-binding protein [Anaerolineae bacterium]|nr:NAD(P)H-binding protein [Anaerolineae bacterium]
MAAANTRRVLVTGGGTFLGDYIAAALLAEGAEVTLLVRPGAEDKLGPLAQRVRWGTADIWNPASLRGRARGQHTVIHTVGSMNADPAQGLNHNWLNFVSARNVANMCVSDGCSHLVLLSSARAPWVPGPYLRAKREAESYIERVGLKATVIRAPVVYVRGQRRHPFFWLMTFLGSLPLVSWVGFGRIAPLPVDILARGVARVALEPQPGKTIYYRRDLRRRLSGTEATTPYHITEDNLRRQPGPLDLLDDDTPFGWTPPGD